MLQHHQHQLHRRVTQIQRKLAVVGRPWSAHRTAPGWWGSVVKMIGVGK
jgi:hypothetical protein